MALFCRDEAEMNYLKIAQDLEMYGVNYFPIAVSALFQQLLVAVGDGAVLLKSSREFGTETPDFCFSVLVAGCVLLVLTCFPCLLKESMNKTVNVLQSDKES